MNNVKSAVQKIRIYLFAGIFFSICSIIFLIVMSRQVGAAWFDDTWSFRKAIPITNNTTAESNVYVQLVLTIGSTSNAQTDDGDIRFTKQDGQLLPYYIVSGAGTTSITVHVLLDNFVAGIQTIYGYYGNPTAPNGFSSRDFLKVASNYSIGSLGSQETTKGPVAYWKLDEGQGGSIYDTTATGIGGSLGTTTAAPTWMSDDQCFLGKCLWFDGSNDYVSVNDNDVFTPNTNLTISLWIRPNTILTGANRTWIITKGTTSNYEWAVFFHKDGSLGCEEWTLDGSNHLGASGDNDTTNITVSPDVWHHVVCSISSSSRMDVYLDGALRYSDTSVAANSIGNGTSPVYLGRRGDGVENTFNGSIDNVKIYPYARTAAQVKSDYSARGTFNGSSINLGSNQQNNINLSNGLIGYWRMDEASGNVSDASGNGMTGTVTGTTVVGGKFGNARSFTTTDQIAVGSIANVKTVSFWIYPTNTTTDIMRLSTSPTTNISAAGNLTATGFDTPKIYVNGVVSSTLTANTWQHVAITTSTAVTADGILLGRISTALAGYLDEVRLYNRSFTYREVAGLYAYAVGPVGYWRMEEGIGATVNDSSGYGNTGTYAGGPSWTPGKIGGALSFNGTSQNVSFGTGASITNLGNSSMSAGAWIYLTNTPADWSEFAIINKGDDASRSWNLKISNRGGVIPRSLVATIYNSVGGSIADAISADSIPLREWHYVSFVYRKGGDNNIHLYLDGIEMTYNSQTNAVGTYLADDTIALKIASYSDNVSYFPGKIDEVTVYNYARTTKQIQQDMGGIFAATGSLSGLPIAYWKFDEGYGTTARSSINGGQAYDSVLTNTTWTNNGKFNKGLVFNGADSQSVSALVSNKTDDFAVSLWAYWAGNNSQLQTLFSNGSNGACTGWTIRLDQANSYRISLLNECIDSADSSISLTQNAWQHIVVQKKSGSWELYINGNKQTLSGGITTTPNAPTVQTTIGRQLSGNYAFNGTIDEVKFYSFALTQDQINADMNMNSAIALGGVAGHTSEGLYPTPSPPVGWWKMDDSVGSYANDSSGNGNRGTLSTPSPLWTQGKYGSALDFLGSRYTEGTISSVAAVSLEAWIYMKTIPSDSNTGKIVALGTVGTSYHYLDILNTSGVITARMVVNNNGSAIASSTTAIRPNTWYHLVGTYSPASGNVYLYVNGVREGQVTFSTAMTATDTFDIGIDLAHATNRSFTGIIDNAMVYNRVLSPTQVLYDFNRGAPVAWYKMNECSGSIIHNSAVGADGKAFSVLNGTLTLGASGQTDPGTCATSGTTAWYAGKNGKFGSSINFDGASDYVNIPYSSTLALTDNLTLSVWLKKTDTGATNYYQPIIAKVNNGDTIEDFNLFIQNNSGNNNKLEITSNTGTAFLSSTSIEDTNWHHVVFTKNGTVVAFYIDGKLDRAATDSNSAFGNTSYDVKLGWDYASPGSYFKGQLDDVRIYNYALTLDQVKKVFNEGFATRFGPVTGTP